MSKPNSMKLSYVQISNKEGSLKRVLRISHPKFAVSSNSLNVS